MTVVNVALVWGVAFVVGYFAAYLSRYIDNLLDYGSLLGAVRYRLARWYTRRNRNLRRVLQNAVEAEDYFERAQEVNNAYWLIARHNFWFTGWVCIVCLSSRVSLVLWLVVLPTLLKSGAPLWSIFTSVIITLVTTFTLISTSE